VILWGICVTLNCVVKNFASLLSLRILLGVFESVSAPSLILIVSMWYKTNGMYLADCINFLILIFDHSRTTIADGLVVSGSRNRTFCIRARLLWPPLLYRDKVLFVAGEFSSRRDIEVLYGICLYE
jgi:MFS family permease